MEDAPPSTSRRFRFRDHSEEVKAVDDFNGDGHTTTDFSSVSSDLDDDTELESMSAQGIRHLCSELLELKMESEEEFQNIVLANYSSFIGIFEGAKNLEHDVKQLKYQVSTQKRLIEDLTNGILNKAFEQEKIEPVFDESLNAQTSIMTILSAHTEDCCDIVDNLLAEHRLDEAIFYLEREANSDESRQLLQGYSPDKLVSYNSAVSEKRSAIVDQLVSVANNPRVSPPELQKALVGLCRLGEDHLATQLLLNYYHLRIASRINDLHSSKVFLHGVYIQEVGKFVFSMISQTVRSYVALHGGTSPYASELLQWADEETEVFANCFSIYVKSLVELSSGLPIVIEAMQITMSYCSLLESQGLVLHSNLIKHITPCIEQVLEVHIQHFKKVIGIFTSSDTWFLGRYLVSGMLNQETSSTIKGQQSEYCPLTNSARKFITLFQAILEEVSPLIALHVEGSIISGLKDLFSTYILFIERALISGTEAEEGDLRINVAESLVQKLSLVANLSTLEQILSNMIQSVFIGFNHLKFEIDSYVLFIHDTCAQIRSNFFKQFVLKYSPSEGEWGNIPACCTGGQEDSKIHDPEPSISYQEFYLELRRLKKHAEDHFIDLDWLTDILKELMEAIFLWISSEEIWEISKEHLSDQNCGNFTQLKLDLHFLVEIVGWGGWFSDNTMKAYSDIVSRMESALVSAGLNSKCNISDDEWATNAAIRTLQKLQESDENEAVTKGPAGELELDADLNGPNLSDINGSSEVSDIATTPKDAAYIATSPKDAADYIANLETNEGDTLDALMQQL
nr:exocyst complex component EXO84A-like [Ipomoea batatas]